MVKVRLAIVQFGDDAGQALLAKGNDDAAANHGLRRVLRDAVSESDVERDGHGHIAE